MARAADAGLAATDAESDARAAEVRAGDGAGRWIGADVPACVPAETPTASPVHLCDRARLYLGASPPPRQKGTAMAGKRSLVAGKPRLLADHRSLDGREYHRAYKALAATFDLRTELARMEAGRCAARWVAWR